MPPNLPPQHTPFGDKSFARAVQAYSVARAGGATLDQAQAAARRACPGCVIPDVAQAAAGARQAASALFGTGPNAARSFGVGSGKEIAAGAGERTPTTRVATVRYQLQPGGAMGSGLGLTPIWKTVQVDIPLGANQGAARAIVEAAIADLAAGDRASYPGEVLAMEAVTIIGV